MSTEKIQKILAAVGYGSRRALEVLIKDGRVRVNNQVAKLGDRADSTKDHFSIDGRPCRRVGKPTESRVLLYNKPLGQVCTRDDPEGRKTVFEGLPRVDNGRWISVGRLDINTSGLLLFTNDGELANRLMHPSSEIQREYAVRILGKVTPEIVENLVNGVELEDGVGRFEHVMDAGGEGANHWFHVVAVEGKNRIVRRLWESQDLTVSRLKRVRFGPIFVPKSLRQGTWLELEKSQIKDLVESIDPEEMIDN